MSHLRGCPHCGYWAVREADYPRDTWEIVIPAADDNVSIPCAHCPRCGGKMPGAELPADAWE